MEDKELIVNPTRTYQDFDKWLLDRIKNAPVEIDGAFGAVIPVTGLNTGFLGQVSRTNSGEPCIVARLANALNTNNISFGDTVVLLPDATGGTYRQLADFIANGGVTAFGTVSTHTNTTIDTFSGGLAGLQVGMLVFGAGIAAGSYITAIGAASITLSQATTATANTVSLYIALFAGIAGREVKTQQTYPLPPGTSQIGIYKPGDMCEVMVGRGSITVKIPVGTPFSNGQVYTRVALNGAIPAGLVGDLEAAPDGVNTIPLTSVVFKTGTIDANTVSEITFLNRILA